MQEQLIKRKSSKQRTTHYFLWLITILISLMVISSFLGFTLRTNAMFDNLLLEQARAFDSQIGLVRRWVWGHGGVYIRQNGDRKDAPRVITSNSGENLNQLNPAEVTQQLSVYSEKSGIVKFRSVSLSPLNPDYKADKFEEDAIARFRQGVTEYYAYFNEKNVRIFRYLTPLKTTKSCLACHADGSFQLGRVDSALSFKIPADKIDEEKGINRLWMILSGIAVITLIAISILLITKRLVRKLEIADIRLEKMASEDVLTGLYNRRMGMDILKNSIAHCIRKNVPLSLVLLDIDHFKKINDTLGHPAGDDGLRALAVVLKAQLRDYDVAFRYGGEEFVVLLPDETPEGAMMAAERIRKAVENNRINTADGEVLQYTVSLGVAGLEPDMDIKTLIANADAALYQAKEQGRNRAILHPT